MFFTLHAVIYTKNSDVCTPHFTNLRHFCCGLQTVKIESIFWCPSESGHRPHILSVGEGGNWDLQDDVKWELWIQHMYHWSHDTSHTYILHANPSWLTNLINAFIHINIIATNYPIVIIITIPSTERGTLPRRILATTKAFTATMSTMIRTLSHLPRAHFKTALRTSSILSTRCQSSLAQDPHEKPANVLLWEKLAEKELSKSKNTVHSLRTERVTPVSSDLLNLQHMSTKLCLNERVSILECNSF